MARQRHIPEIFLGFMQQDAMLQVGFEVCQPESPAVAAAYMDFHFGILLQWNIFLPETKQDFVACC